MKKYVFSVVVLMCGVVHASNPQLLDVPADDGGAALLAELLLDFREPPVPSPVQREVPVSYASVSLNDADFSPAQKPIQKGGAKAGIGRASGGYSSGFAVQQQAGIFKAGGCGLLRNLFPRARARRSARGFVRYSTAPAFRGFAGGGS